MDTENNNNQAIKSLNEELSTEAIKANSNVEFQPYASSFEEFFHYPELFILRADQLDLYTDDGETPLTHAGKHHNTVAAGVLLALGADPNRPNRMG